MSEQKAVSRNDIDEVAYDLWRLRAAKSKQRTAPNLDKFEPGNNRRNE
jgi:hypothetical protein